MKTLPLKFDFFQICVTNVCNNRCIMCHQSDPKYQSKQKFGFMSYNMFKKIFDDLKKDNITFPVLHLFWQGEPFLNNDFIEMIEYALKINHNNHIFDNFYINTNGIPLNKNKIKKLVNMLNQYNISSTINFSIDSVNCETYKKIRIGGDFNKMMENIKFFLKYRENNNYSYPYFIYQMVIQEINGNEKDEFALYWSELLKKYNKTVDYEYNLTGKQKDIVLFRFLQQENKVSRKQWNEAVTKWCEKNVCEDDREKVRSLGSKIPEKLQYPCFHYFKTPIIDHKGNVLLCCVDFYSDLKVGNLKNNTFKEIWTGKLLENIREKAVKLKFNELPVFCQNCHLYKYYPLNFREELIDYMEKREFNENNIKSLIELNEKIPIKFETPTEYYELGKIWFNRNEFEKAIYNFERSLELGGKKESILLLAANAYIKNNNFKKAYENSLEYIDLFPDRIEGYRIIIDIFNNSNILDIEKLSNIFIKGECLQAYKELAKLFIDKGMIDNAISTYLKISENDISLKKILFHLYCISKDNKNAFKIISENYNIIVSKDSISDILNICDLFYDNCSKILEKTENFVLEHNDHNGFWHIGMFYQKNNDLKKAKKYIKLSIEEDKFKLSGFKCLGYIEIEFENWENALDNFQKALKISEDVEIIRNIGYIYNKLNKYFDSAQYYEKLYCFENNEKWLEKAGFLYKEDNKYKKALECLTKIKNIKNNNISVTIDFCKEKIK